MRIDSDLSQLNNISFSHQPITKGVNSNDSLFESFYNSAIALIDETNQIQVASDFLQQDFAAGKTDNILSVIMAQEKAATSLSFTVQVTNKVIEAYREIMRIQM